MAQQIPKPLPVGHVTPTGEDLNKILVMPQVATSSGIVLPATTGYAGALQLTCAVNEIATAPLGSGVILPGSRISSTIVTLFNDGVNPIKVYAGEGATIDSVAGTTGVTLTNAKAAIFAMIAPFTWKSGLLGGPSA